MFGADQDDEQRHGYTAEYMFHMTNSLVRWSKIWNSDVNNEKLRVIENEAERC